MFGLIFSKLDGSITLIEGGGLENCLVEVWTVAWYSFNGSGEREDGITGFELVTGLSALICLTGEVGFDSADSNIIGQEVNAGLAGI